MLAHCVAIASISGCASYDIFEDRALPSTVNVPAPLVGEYDIKLKLFETRAEVKSICGSDALACATPTTKPCIIFADIFTYRYAISHEVTHCTNGFWHGR